MSKLRKNAEHDIPNRDAAILYINEKFYEDATHSMCLMQFLKENNITDYDTQSIRQRPSIGEFLDLSKKYSPIIIGHLVKKEDGVFIQLMYDNGQMKEYSNIPQDIKDKFKEHYNLKVYDDFGTEPEDYDIDEVNKKFYDRKKEVEDEIKSEGNKILENNGFKLNDSGDCYFRNDMIAYYHGDKNFVIVPIGKQVTNAQIQNLEFLINSANDVKELLDSFNAEYSPVDYETFYVEFTNLNGINLQLELNSFAAEVLNCSNGNVDDINDKYDLYGDDLSVTRYLNLLNNYNVEQVAKIKSRLRKLAKHDIPNRDAAIVYINNKFYEASTHAICIHNFLEENNKKNSLVSIQERPTYQQFEELSEEYGEIVLAHLVKKEDGVFIICGYNNGNYEDFDKISQKALNAIKDNYGLEIYDDLKTGDTLVDNGYDRQEKSQEFKDERDQLNEDLIKKTIKIITDMNYTKNTDQDGDYYTSPDKSTNVRCSKMEYIIYKFGLEVDYATESELDSILNYESYMMQDLNNYNATFDTETIETFYAMFNAKDGTPIKLFSDNGKVHVEEINGDDSWGENSLYSIVADILWQESNHTYDISNEIHDLDPIYNLDYSNAKNEYLDKNIDNLIDVDDFI